MMAVCPLAVMDSPLSVATASTPTLSSTWIFVRGLPGFAPARCNFIGDEWQFTRLWPAITNSFGRDLVLCRGERDEDIETAAIGFFNESLLDISVAVLHEAFHPELALS